MELLERYLHTVRAFLPDANQDDIIRELRENLMAEIEDQETKLGRSLTDAELSALLQRHGHPVIVASRFRPNSYLVGPVIYPFFWIGLRIVLVLAAVLTVVSTLPRISIQNFGETLPHALIQMPFQFVSIGLPLFALLTIAAIVAEVSHERLHWFKSWSPHKLPPLKKQGGGLVTDAANLVNAATTASDFTRNIRGFDWANWERTRHPCGGYPWATRASAAGELFGRALFIAWWALLPHYSWLILGPAYREIALAPVWSSAYLPVLGLGIACFGLYLLPVIFHRPAWLRDVVHVCSAVLGLFGLQYFMHADAYLVAVRPDAQPDLAHIIEQVNRYGKVALVIASVGVTVKILFRVGRLFWRAKWVQPGAPCAL